MQHTLKYCTTPSWLSFLTLLLLNTPSFMAGMARCTYATVHDAAQASDLQFVAEQLSMHARIGKKRSIINSFDRQGHTLLTRALMGKNGKSDKTNNNMVQFLLDCKADPGQTTQAGESPLKMALDGGNFGAITILLDHGAKTPEDVPSGLLDAVRSLLSAVQNQSYLIESQKKEIIQLEQELALYHERCECQGYLSSDSEILSGQDKPKEEEEEEVQEGPDRQESPENPDIGPSQTPPSPRFAPYTASRSVATIPLAAPTIMQSQSAHSKSPRSPATLLEDWELVEEQEGAQSPCSPACLKT